MAWHMLLVYCGKRYTKQNITPYNLGKQVAPRGTAQSPAVPSGVPEGEEE